MSDTTITGSDAGSTVELERGNTLTVRLEEVPTTGYRWAVDHVDSRILEFQESNYEQYPEAGVDGGGRHTFTFRAAEAGTTTLTMVLRREWDPENPDDRFEVSVDVRR
jgi:predicted secreted protein